MLAEVNGNSEAVDPRFMASLARGLEVLRAFEDQAPLTVTQAAKLTGLPRSAVGRCLFTLEQLGYLEMSGLSFHLRPALLPLTQAFVTGNPLARAGQRVVDSLRDRLGESSSLAMFDTRSGFQRVVYVCRAETARIISVPLLAGSTLPSYCTSNGRVLLAGLSRNEFEGFVAAAPFPTRTAATLVTADALHVEISRVQMQGYALTDGELETGLRSIAVPVRGQDGQVLAALNLATQSNHNKLGWLTKTALPELQAAAAHLARVAAG